MCIEVHVEHERVGGQISGRGDREGQKKNITSKSTRERKEFRKIINNKKKKMGRRNKKTDRYGSI